MALDEAEMKELSLLSLDVVAPIACGLIAVPAAGASEPGAKNDPVAEKAAEAEADVMTAEKESADVKYTKQYSAEMKLGGYDGDNFKKAQREAFAKFVSKLTGADLAAVTIDSFGVVTGRRLLKASGKVKVAFTVQAKTADSATKGVAAINGLDGAA